MRHLSIALLALVVWIVASSVPAQGQSDQILYRTDYPTLNGNAHVWKMRPDGTQKAALTHAGPDYNPNLCPDGQNFVYDSYGDLYLRDIQALNQPVQITSGGDFDEDADCGRKANGYYKLVFTRENEIWVGSTNPSATPTQRYASSLVDYHAGWCGNNAIVFSHQKQGGFYDFQICTMPATSGDPTCFPVPSATADRFPNCTLDAEQIVFTRASGVVGAPAQICMMSSHGDGSDMSCPADPFDPNNTAHNMRPVWNPGGTQIAYRSDLDDFDGDIWIMNPEGTIRANITSDQSHAADEPDWGGVPLQ